MTKSNEDHLFTPIAAKRLASGMMMMLPSNVVGNLNRPVKQPLDEMKWNFVHSYIVLLLAGRVFGFILF